VYLGIDLGTSALKLLLLDDGHRIVAMVSEALTVSRPQPLWSEQDPHDWWAALERAMQRLRADKARELAAVRAIGLSGQMHGAVLIDADDAVLRPAILWNDGRSALECDVLTAALPTLSQVTGNVAMPGFTAPKLLWLRTNEPACFERVARVLLPKDWLRLQMTGDAVSDPSDASGTLWLDVGRRGWWDDGLAACGLDRRQMPRLVEGSEVSAALRVPLARQWGLPAGIPVAGGAGDNAASAVGMGAVQPGQGFLSLGTSGVVFVADDRFAPDPQQGVHTFCHALPGRWHRMSVMLSAASALQWAKTLLGQPDEAALLGLVAGLTPAQRAGAPLFLPYLDGERTPHNDPQAQGVLFGLRHEHGAAQIGYAVIEGVGFGLLDGWRALGGSATAATSLALVGGGARSALWAQLLASTLGVVLHQPVDGEAGAALGAARLAWLADGGGLAEVCRAPALRRSFEPDADEARLLAPRAGRFRALYPALRDSFRAAAGGVPTPDRAMT
jgi:xylulokinase